MPRNQRLRVLIAEDDKQQRNIIHGFLTGYGDCDAVADGMQVLDAFMLALKEDRPYGLICLNAMMPRVDGIKALRVIRDLEKQFSLTPDYRAKILMILMQPDENLRQRAREQGCDLFVHKPFDMDTIAGDLARSGFCPSVVTQQEEPASAAESEKIIRNPMGFFHDVHPEKGYMLTVVMKNGTEIQFQCNKLFHLPKFQKLRDPDLFYSVYTDGEYIIFERPGVIPVEITVSEFMDFVLMDKIN